ILCSVIAKRQSAFLGGGGIIARHSASGAKPPDTAWFAPKVEDTVIQQPIILRQVYKLLAVESRHTAHGCNPGRAIVRVVPEFANFIRGQAIAIIVRRPMAFLERRESEVD